MKRYFNILILIFLLAGVVATQYFFDTHKKRLPFTEPLVLKPDIVRAADLGLHNAAADVAWLSAVQYLGGTPSKTSEKLDDYLFLSVELDPKFSYPYAFGALMLPAASMVDQGIALAEKGMSDAAPDWRIPYYTATTYHMDKKDTKNAARYFDVAARTPGAPVNIQFVAANFGSRPDLRSQTRLIWQGILQNSTDEVVIDQAKKYLTHLEILDILEAAAREYKNRHGSYPKTIDNMVEDKIIRFAPLDPFGFVYQIDQESGRATAKLQ